MRETENKLVLKEGLKKSHGPNALVSGTGVTLAEPLKASHQNGAAVATTRPTPGAANIY